MLIPAVPQTACTAGIILGVTRNLKGFWYRETADRIVMQGIGVKVERTSKAVGVYNDLQRATTVIAALHLVC
jgi:hypothetical protein